MEIYFNDEEVKWLKKMISSHLEFCNIYHPPTGRVHLAIFIPDEDLIRSIYNKISGEHD